jgi:6-phosphogluconolactonase
MKSEFRGRMNVGVAILILILASVAPLSIHAIARAKSFVYFGTYPHHGSKGIYVSTFDSTSGHISSPKLAVETSAPSFLAINSSHLFLYAVNETNRFNDQPTGAVSAFAVDSTTGRLKFLNEVPSRGAGPAFITLDRTEHFALVANYDGGSIAVFRLSPDGKIGESTAYVAHRGGSVNRDRQEAPHAHAVAVPPDNHFAIVADLGLDELLEYPFDASGGTLGQPRIVRSRPGDGPRHLIFSANGKFVYVVNELSSTVTVYSYDSRDAALAPLQELSSLPAGYTGTASTAGEIVLHPSGKFLYASNRGEDKDSIAVFDVDTRKGTLALVENVSTQGRTPRSFAIDPSGKWMLVANQDSNAIFVFSIGEKTGRLTASGQSIQINSPAMVDFISPAGEK